MLKNIKKIIKAIGSKYILLMLLLITTTFVSYNINAMSPDNKAANIVTIDEGGLLPPGQKIDDGGLPLPKIDPSKTFSFTYEPKSGEGDYVTITFTPNKGLSWKGKVTLRNGCEFIQQNSINFINYFVAPGVNDPVYSFNLTIGTKGEMCTQALQMKTFSGELKEATFADYQLLNIKKYITVNWMRTDKPTPPVDPIDYGKLKWEEANPEYIASNNYRFFLKSTYSRTIPNPSECISVVTYYGGSTCKTVIVKNYNKKNNIVTTAKDAPTLRKYFGPVNTFAKAHFIADILRNQLWDAGEAKLGNKYYVRVNNECTTDATYYELVTTPITYEFKFIKRVTGGYPGPAKCT
jgi:hypothetical protein